MRQISIQVTEDDYKILKGNNYVLCIAKRVEDCDFNVIWQAEKNFSQNNIISWEGKYSIFVSRTMQRGQTVFFNVPPHEILPGQSITLEEEGCFGKVESFGAQDEITMLNQYMPVYPGLCQMCTDFAGITSSAPFYLSPDLCIPGTFITKPTEQIMVWFAQGAKSGLIISQNKKLQEEKAISNCITLDMNTKNNIKLVFDKFQWKIVN